MTEGRARRPERPKHPDRPERPDRNGLQVGDRVFYTAADGGSSHLAFVDAVHEDTGALDLNVLTAGQLTFMSSVPHADGDDVAPGTWSHRPGEAAAPDDGGGTAPTDPTG
jgi:hypothetical protein